MDPSTKFQFFNANTPKGNWLMNQTYDLAGANEATLYLSQYVEFCHLFGTDIVFITRDVKEAEAVFGEFLYKKIDKGYPMRVFVQEVEGWGGAGDTYQKFGLQIQDECTIYCPKILFSQMTSGTLFPKYNDLIWIPKTKKLFEILHIEDEVPPAFYLLGSRSGYMISCRTYVYDHSEIGDDLSIPLEVQSLDRIFTNPSTSAVVDFDAEEVLTNNVPLNDYVSDSAIIDESEIDPLFR